MLRRGRQAKPARPVMGETPWKPQEDDMPWMHLDIAGVASVKSETDFAPKGATGWGVRSLNRLISDIYEL